MKLLAVPAFSILLGLLAYQANRNVMYPDGVSYLEIGDAIFRDGWMAAANGCWSPLLALLAGLANAIFHPSPAGEFRLANGVNFLIYLGSVAALEWMIRRYWARFGDGTALSRPAFGVLLHAVHFTGALIVTGMMFFTPDILLMACVYLALGAILGPAGPRGAALLGLALGLGYLGKSAFLITGGLLLAVAMMIWRPRAGWLRDTAIAGAVFAAVGALYFVPVSMQKGRLTLAENGRVNYLTHVLGVKSPGAADPRFGPLAIPVETVAASPQTYALPRWNGVSYPFHYDVSRFYDTWKFSMSPGAMAGAARKSLLVYAGTLRNPAVMLLVICAVALFAGAQSRGMHPLSWLLVPVFGSAAAFALVHVEPRYTAPLFVPGCLGVLAGLGVSDPARRRLLGYLVTAAAVLCALIVLRASVGSGLIRDSHPEARFAETLAKAGLKRGDAVAVIGLGYSRAWARVGGYWIATETPDREGYGKSSAEQRQSLDTQLRARGVRALITQGNGPQLDGWVKAQGTAWAFRMLD